MARSDDFEFFDPEILKIAIYGLSIAQLRKIIEFYEMRTGDVDCEHVEEFTKSWR